MGLQTYHRGIRDAKIAAWTSENNYGTEYDIKGIRNATLTWVVETDELGGDDVILDRFTNIVSVTVAFEQAAVDLEAVDMMVGGTLVSNPSYEDLVIGKINDLPPYVALAGRVLSSDGAADFQFMVPKAKLSGNLQFQAQYQQYMIPGAEFQGVYEGETNGILRFRKFTAATALEIPLRTTTGGL